MSRVHARDLPARSSSAVEKQAAQRVWKLNTRGPSPRGLSPRGLRSTSRSKRCRRTGSSTHADAFPRGFYREVFERSREASGAGGLEAQHTRVFFREHMDLLPGSAMLTFLCSQQRTSSPSSGFQLLRFSRPRALSTFNVRRGAPRETSLEATSLRQIAHALFVHALPPSNVGRVPYRPARVLPH